VDQTQALVESQAAKSLKTKSSEKGLAEQTTGNSDDSFNKQLVEAGAVAGAQAVVMHQPTQVSLSKKALGIGKEEAVQGVHPKQFSAMSDVAEYTPVSAKTASGVSAGSSIAGLKPWNQEWVFEGMPRPSDDGAKIRPLIGGKSVQDEIGEITEIAQAREALKKINALADSGDSLPGAEQVKSLQMRGIEGLKKDDGAMIAVNSRLASQLPQQLAVAGGPGAQGVQSAQSANEEAIAQAIAQMNGKVINAGVRRNQMPNSLNSALGAKDGTAASGLSGSEFMNTLTLVKPGASPVSSMDEVQAIGNRPSLEVLSGDVNSRLGLKKAGPQFSEFALSAGTLNHSPNQSFAMPQMAQVTGHVVPGAGTQDQLSHEAILNVTTGIRNLGQGNGEMNIRLKPDNLGELHLKVMTRGQEVGLQIQASDENAKKILQDSISSLKDGLATQNLTLGKVELSIAKAFTGGEASNQQFGQQSGQHQQSQSQFDQSRNGQPFSMFGQNAGQQNQGSNGWAGNGEPQESNVRSLNRGSVAAQANAAMAAARANSRAAQSDGRIDVLA
jgi:flagellar hook-length control protein FliK